VSDHLTIGTRKGRTALPVDARGLVKRYGSFAAVDHVDLTVEAGGVCGFLGPNDARTFEP
jgi:ABC-2 type transport system ATP-binding protein